MKQSLTFPVFDVELQLLAEFAKKEGVSLEQYSREVVNAHIRSRVGLPEPRDTQTMKEEAHE